VDPFQWTSSQVNQRRGRASLWWSSGMLNSSAERRCLGPARGGLLARSSPGVAVGPDDLGGVGEGAAGSREPFREFASALGPLLGIAARLVEELPEQIRKQSPTTRDSGETRVTMSGSRSSQRRSIECR
jgi:hypothetical protein